MSVISDIEGRVQDRLEEPRGPGIFWSLQAEIRPKIVEAMYMATLIAGEPEIRQTVATTIPVNTTLQPMPAGAVAMLRVEGPESLAVKKETLWSLSQMVPGWETESGTTPKKWFPVGLTQWGIYPRMTEPINVVITYIGVPVLMPGISPIAFTGQESIPFQAEYLEGFEEYAASMSRFKEATQEFFDGLKEFDRFLSRTWELSKFATRKGSLRFTRTRGAVSKVTDVTSK